MKTSPELPPNWHLIQGAFPDVDWEQGIAVTYGDTVYSKYPLHKMVMVHEQVHIDQQSIIGRDIWWKKYLTDAAFRIEQEKPAYTAQAEFIRENVRDRNQAFKLLHKLALDLSGAMYGKMISFREATELLY